MSIVLVSMTSRSTSILLKTKLFTVFISCSRLLWNFRFSWSNLISKTIAIDVVQIQLLAMFYGIIPNWMHDELVLWGQLANVISYTRRRQDLHVSCQIHNSPCNNNSRTPDICMPCYVFNKINR